jgi:dimethylargininase
LNRVGLAAITRAVSPELARCELTHQPRVPIDTDRAAAQHSAYESLLAELGCELHRLPALSGCPDCVFVEDTAVVVDELAIIARPGAPSRRPERAAVAAALADHRRLSRIVAPGTLDGGDVLVTGRRAFVGLSSRTNASGAAQLAAALGPAGYEVSNVPVGKALHLKSAVTEAAPGLLLIDAARIDPAAFAGFERVETAPGEAAAANALRIGETLVLAAGFPRTRARLEALGLTVVETANDELAKAEGGLTCCSLLLALYEPGETPAASLG